MGNDFGGFPLETFRFLDELERNNNREWFNARLDTVEQVLVAPAQAFVTAFGKQAGRIYPELVYDTKVNGAGSMFRLSRDTRFSKDKTPYKTNVGLRFWLSHDERACKRVRLYVHVDSDGVKVYGGEHCHLEPSRLDALRVALVNDGAGRIKDVMDGLVQRGFGEDEVRMKRIPRGYPEDHPNADLFRRKSLFVRSPRLPRKIAATPEVIERCVAFAAELKPLNDWLGKSLAGS